MEKVLAKNGNQIQICDALFLDMLQTS